jgi:hypothetical protein
MNIMPSLMSISFVEVSSATLADVMHLLEEGIVNICFRFFLSLCAHNPGNLDDYVSELLGPKANRCFGRRAFPVSISPGAAADLPSWGLRNAWVLLALVLVMQTDRGREILKERFTVGFDQRRKELLGLAVKESDVDDRSRRGGQRRRRGGQHRRC